MLLWKLNCTMAEVDVASEITTFFSWLVLAFPRDGEPPPPSAPVLVTVAMSDDPGSGSCSATVLLAMWGSLAMTRSTVCCASPAGLEATQVKEPGTQTFVWDYCPSWYLLWKPGFCDMNVSNNIEIFGNYTKPPNSWKIVLFCAQNNETYRNSEAP